MESCSAEIHAVQPHRVQRPETWVMGLELRTANLQDMHPLTAEMPQLWHWCLTESILHDLPDAINPSVFYGVYTNYNCDDGCEHRGEYSVIAAVEVISIDNPLENMVGVAIPAGEYLVFEVKGDRPHAVIQTWQQIWDYFTPNCRDQRAFTTDFEVYAPGQICIYIALKTQSPQALQN